MYGHKGQHLSPFEVLDYVSRSHDVVKTALEQQAYGRALERGITNTRARMKKSGMSEADIDGAMQSKSLQSALEARAYAASLDAKFQGDNAVAKWWNNSVIRAAENSDNPFANLFGLVAKTQAPIVKIPLNYAADFASYLPGGGLSKALAEFPEDVTVAATQAADVAKKIKRPADPTAEPWPPMKAGTTL
jgi:hypothetical protein